MDAVKIGAFLAALRKTQGLTQQAVAERLGVTDKTISKWETARGLPDITVLPALAALYGVSVDELLAGERTAAAEDGGAEPAREQEAYMAAYVQNRCAYVRKYLLIALAVGLCGLLVLYALVDRFRIQPFGCPVGMLFFVISAVLLVFVYPELKGLQRRSAADGVEKCNSLFALSFLVTACGILLDVALFFLYQSLSPVWPEKMLALAVPSLLLAGGAAIFIKRRLSK